MKKLSIEERKAAYLKAAQHFSDAITKAHGFCQWLLWNELGYPDYGSRQLAEYYPELAMCAPYDEHGVVNKGYWFDDDHTDRIMALLFAAEMCE